MQLLHSISHLSQACCVPSHLGLLCRVSMLPQLCQGEAGTLDAWALLIKCHQGLQALCDNVWHHLHMHAR